MKTNGIRILDKKVYGKTRIVSVNLEDILGFIGSGNKYRWSILYIDAYDFIGGNQGIPNFEEIRVSEKGLLITWNDLNNLALRFEQIIDLTLIGSFDEALLKRFAEDREMYETCDIVIEMIDSSYWEVFSKDDSLIQRLAEKFQDTLLLTSDFDKATT